MEYEALIQFTEQVLLCQCMLLSSHPAMMFEVMRQEELSG